MKCTGSIDSVEIEPTDLPKTFTYEEVRVALKIAFLDHIGQEDNGWRVGHNEDLIQRALAWRLFKV